MAKRKANGAEILDFYLNGWPGKDFVHDWYDEDGNEPDCPFEDLIQKDGVYSLSDLGVIYDETKSDGRGSYQQPYTFSELFNKWYANNHFATIVVQLPKEDLERFKALIKPEKGWTLVS